MKVYLTLLVVLISAVVLSVSTACLVSSLEMVPVHERSFTSPGECICSSTDHGSYPPPVGIDASLASLSSGRPLYYIDPTPLYLEEIHRVPSISTVPTTPPPEVLL